MEGDAMTNNKRHLRLLLLLAILLAILIYINVKPDLPYDHSRISRMHCTGRLCNIGKCMLLYADDHMRNFPISEKPGARAHDTFQMLVDAMPDEITPEMFICPGAKDVPAKCDENGMFKLKPENVSYAVRKAPLKIGISTRTILACDKSLDNHEGRAGINVMNVEAGVRWMTIQELEAEGGLDAFLAKHHLVR